MAVDQQKLLERITTNPSIFGGKPMIRRHQLAVEQVLGMMAAGDTIETILSNYPELELEDIQACLIYAQQLVNQRPFKIWSMEDLKLGIPKVIEQMPYLKLIVIFGSRARGNAHQNSDWDFAVLYDEERRKHYEKGGWDTFRIWGVLQKVYDFPDDKLDIVDLSSCPELLAHQIAQDGQFIYEYEKGEFERFRQSTLKSPEEIKQINQELRDKIERRLRKLRT